MQSGKKVKNSFFSLLGKSMRLLYEAEHTDDIFLKRCLVTSSILTSIYCLEAASNSVLEALEERVNEKDYQLLEKFELVLLKNTSNKIDKGCKEYQSVKRLIQLRNESVHPKVSSKKITYKSEKTDGNYAWSHQEFEKTCSSNKSIQRLPLEIESWSVSEAELSIQAVVSFLNIFVCKWWGLDKNFRDYIFLPQSDVAKHGGKLMYDIDTLKMLKIYEESIELKFINMPVLSDATA